MRTVIAATQAVMLVASLILTGCGSNGPSAAPIDNNPPDDTPPDDTPDEPGPVEPVMHCAPEAVAQADGSVRIAQGDCPTAQSGASL